MESSRQAARTRCANPDEVRGSARLPASPWDPGVARLSTARSLYPILLAVLLVLGPLAIGVNADRCAKLTEQLGKLRQEYRDYVTQAAYDIEPVTFDHITEILDRITALKRTMREANCKVPRRRVQLGDEEPAPKNKGKKKRK